MENSQTKMGLMWFERTRYFLLSWLYDLPFSNLIIVWFWVIFDWFIINFVTLHTLSAKINLLCNLFTTISTFHGELYDHIVLDKIYHSKRARRDLNPRPNAPQALTLSILSHEPNNLLGKIVKNVWKRTMLLFLPC